MTKLTALLLLVLALLLGACDAPAPDVRPGPPDAPQPPPMARPTVTPEREDPPPIVLPDPTPAEARRVPTPPTIDEPLETRLMRTPPPRDLLELHRRLKGGSLQDIPIPQPKELQVGDRRSFWIMDSREKRYLQIEAILRYATPDLYFFVEEGHEFPEGDIRKAADIFAEGIAPRLRDYFGSEWTPGIDNDPRLVILNASIPGSPGYFSSNDEHPRAVNPYSNESEVIYVNLRFGSPGAGGYYATLAHEFQHMVQWNNDPSEDAWVNEGLAELASRLAGYPVSSVSSFVNSPDTQLNTWDEDPGRALPHYGAAYAFFSYLAERYGGYFALKDLVKVKKHGIVGVEEFLRTGGHNRSFDDVFREWVVANLLDDPGLGDGRYGYRDLDLRVTPGKLPVFPAGISNSVRQYAAQYWELPAQAGDLEIVFTGTKQVKLVPNEPHSGKWQWWSNRGDVMDTSLTREFDLTGVDRASLRAWLWFDIEKDYDYAYVQISADGGNTWTILPGKYTTALNPNGNSFGPAYTGKSGGGGIPVWIEDEFDLAEHAGKRVLIRFEYVTDDANNLDGFVVDDVSIPELGLADDVESDGSWVADGFILSDNYVSQNYLVQLVQPGEREVVRTLPIDAERMGRWRVEGLDPQSPPILVISGVAPVTTQTAPYELSVQRAP